MLLTANFCPLRVEFFLGFLIESLNTDITSYEGSLLNVSTRSFLKTDKHERSANVFGLNSKYHGDKEKYVPSYPDNLIFRNFFYRCTVYYGIYILFTHQQMHFY